MIRDRYGAEISHRPRIKSGVTAFIDGEAQSDVELGAVPNKKGPPRKNCWQPPDHHCSSEQMLFFVFVGAAIAFNL